ncbi:hypothetical protein C8A01DRAFT_34467 [Parachaetomium inaequale]|uniref:Uncharacterized protein n=1 Tax=Parachaetomium inaequale TaxID=2588326 RepID=A0AAN6PN32_9PEZI|nr:hypothetical protein C8A01DRAFT_34467 [Parachaetomium inaequale]
MGLFSRHGDPAHEPAPQGQPAYEERQPAYEEPPKRHGLFGSKHHSPTRAPTNATHSTRSSTTASTSPDRTSGGGIFRRSTDASYNGSQRTGLLHRSFGNGNRGEMMDPSIIQARERVMVAEAAETEADRALMAARESVREAREHVRKLELEAKEEARRAKIKEQHAKEFSKRGKMLGRHDY